MNNNTDKFAAAETSSSPVSGKAQKTPVQGSSKPSVAGSTEMPDGSQSENQGQCAGGVCSLNWRPLRPAA